MIGQRIQIINAHDIDPAYNDPRPDLIGEYGTITGVQVVPFETPVITLDNGTQLLGSECWWSAVEEVPA